MSETSAINSNPLIVYVDDGRPNRIVFEQSLRSEFNIIAMADAASALEVIAQHDVAVVVTDVRMPTMNGDELLRIVKERSPQTLRMIITAFADVEPILRAVNEGLVVRYIIKPWVREELVRVLRWATEAWTFSRDSAALHRRLLETERLATLGSVAERLAQDLQQPLTSLLARLEHLHALANATPTMLLALGEMSESPNRDRIGDLLSELPSVATDCKTAALRMTEMLAGLRDFVRPPATDGTTLCTDPLPIVRRTMTVCQDLVIGARASIGYQGPETLPAVRMSPAELTQVLIHLVSNGAQAVAARGVPNGSVAIVAHTEAGVLELEIRDDGVGMAPHVLKRVGTPFFTTRIEGTGLGIAHCQRVIGTAGGRLWIESKPGVGTTVTISLPLAA